MAADLMAITGVASVQGTIPAVAAASSGGDGGEVFADVIAAAMADSVPAEAAATDGAADWDAGAMAMSGEMAVGLPELLAALAGASDIDADVPVVIGDGSRLDRDAGAEGLQGALASMLGALMRPVVVTAPSDVVAVAAQPATGGGTASLVLAQLDGTEAALAQGSAADPLIVAPAVIEAGAEVDAGIAIEGFDLVANEATADLAPALAAAIASELSSPEAAENESPAGPVGQGAALAVAVDVVSETTDSTRLGSAEVAATAPFGAEASDADVVPDGPALPTKPESEADVAMPVVLSAALAAPEAVPTQVAARSIALNEAQPLERRTDDRLSVVPGAVTSQPAPQSLPQAAAAVSEVIVATDGQSLASAVANSVQLATLRGDREMTLALNPPDLGHLTVEITGDASGGMSIAIHASSSEAHDLLQQHLPTLLSSLEQRDVRVERLQVDQQGPSAGLEWTDRGGRESRGRRESSDDDGQPQWSPLAALRRGAEAAASGVTSAGVRSGAVDVRA